MGCKQPIPWQQHGDLAACNVEDSAGADAKIEVTDEISEWDYGDYEGITSQEIAQQRKEKGEGTWDIWRDGCPGGE